MNEETGIISEWEAWQADFGIAPEFQSASSAEKPADDNTRAEYARFANRKIDMDLDI